jgi:hypothetical protein
MPEKYTRDHHQRVQAVERECRREPHCCMSASAVAIGRKVTWPFALHMSANDPKRTYELVLRKVAMRLSALNIQTLSNG